MRVLDLFCGGGGAGMGYFKAGFEVVGVDIKKQPHYPFKFIQMDALEALQKYGQNFDIIHASPPCQGYSPFVKSENSQWVKTRGKSEPRLINPLRKILLSFENKPYIIENVLGAKSEMFEPILLCGRMFNLPTLRHRLFETNWIIPQPEHPKCRGFLKEYSKEYDISYRDLTISGKGRNAGTSDRWKSFMDITWDASQSELAEMIPPAYTEYIGKILKELL